MIERNATIDVSRSLAVIFIVGIWHLTAYTDFVVAPWFFEFFKNASLGMFMFISSYLLSKSYNFSSVGDVMRFYLKRIVRVIPLFAVSLFSYWVAGFFDFSVIAYSLVGVSVFVPPMIDTLWFVSMIVTFYLLFPLFGGRGVGYQIGFLFCVLSCLYLFKVYDVLSVDRRLFYYFPCFAGGAILAPVSISAICSLRLFGGALLAFVSFSCCYYFGLADFVHRYVFRSAISFTGAFVILGIAFRLTRISSLMPVFNWVSYGSMATYLFHRQLFQLIEDYIWWPGDGVGRYIYLLLLCIPGIMAVGFCIQWSYDAFVKRCFMEVK